MISFQNISIQFGSKNVLSNVNLSAKNGQFTALIGNNGAGKSSLLKTILGQVEYTGRIEVNGIDVRQSGKLAREVALVNSGRISIPGMQVKEVLETGRSPYTGLMGKLTPADIEVIRQVVDQLELNSFLNQQIDSLSDGEFQQVMVARALVQSTPIIIMDEPTSFLDVKNKQEHFKTMNNAALAQQKSILIATHDVTDALAFCNNFWVFDDGEITAYPEKNTALLAHLNRIFNTNY